MIVVNKGKGVHYVTREDCASSPEVFISGVLEYELGISMSLLLLDFGSCSEPENRKALPLQFSPSLKAPNNAEAAFKITCV